MTGQQSYLDELVQAALDYAARGWHVFPLVPYTKKPACPAHTAARCDKSDPYCRHGHTSWEDRATRDPGRIRRAWSNRPYGIGIACGPSRLVVIDTDVSKPGAGAPSPWGPTGIRAGDGVLANLAADAGQKLPATWTVATPSGGFHRYYQAPAGIRLGNTAGKLGWLIDPRGRGGHVVAPPSRLLRGRYHLIDGYPDPVPLPDWLTHLLRETATRPQPATSSSPAPVQRQSGPDDQTPTQRYVTAAIAAETGHVRHAASGQRNHALFCASVALGQLVGGRQVDETTVHDLLLAACVDHVGVDGFTAAEANATIASGLGRGKTQPRTRNGRTAA